MRARPTALAIGAALIGSCARTVSPADVPTPRAAPCVAPSPPFASNAFTTTQLATGDRIEAMSGTSSDDLWAVGWSDADTRNRGLIAHRDATGWHEVHRRGDGISAVHAIAPDDAWAVTTEELLHWNGREWNVVTVPGQPAAFTDVWASGPHDVWVGRSGPALHFDGSNWTPVAFPDAGWDISLSVSGTAADDVWLAGVADGTDEAAVRHWDGARWTVHPFPEVHLYRHGYPEWGVVAVARDDVWMTRLRDDRAMHWDGREWSWIDGVGWDEIAGACARHVWLGRETLRFSDGERLTEIDTGTITGIGALAITPEALWLATGSSVTARPW